MKLVVNPDKYVKINAHLSWILSPDFYLVFLKVARC